MISALSMILSSVVAAPEPAKPALAPPMIGASIADFKLRDIHRRTRSLSGFKDKKAFVVVFLDTECPVGNLYAPGLVDFHKEYAEKGVQFLAINSSAQDPFVSVAAHAHERDLPFPVLKDFEHHVADTFGATRSPEVFLLDAKYAIRYHGRIDDQYAVGGVRRDKPTRRDLKLAIDELLAGKVVSVAKTELSGCPIERTKKPKIAGEVTYTKHIAGLMQKHCQECHRPGEIGPFSLLTFDDAKKRSSRIREALVEQRMPPWHADPRYGHFVNDRRLPSADRELLLAWIDQGTPKGDDKDLPPAKKFPEGWKIGKPDQIFSITEEFKVPATGVLDYKRFVVDTNFKEDVWIQAAECRPGNRAVVHHILVYILPPGRRDPYSFDGTVTTLSGWAPGDMPSIYPAGTARKVPANSKLMFEIHYTPNGTEQTDRSSVAIIKAPKAPELAVEMNILANLRLRIPPNTANHKGEMTYVFRDDAVILSLLPHMHLRGTSAKYSVTYPDGKTEILLSVPDYDFNWQTGYRFKEPKPMPKGTKLTWNGWWDNSSDNPRNPDPTKEVRWGLQTWDEMQNGWMEIVWKKAEPKKE